MELESIYQSIAELKKEVAQLKHEKERLEAANICRNMVGRYLYYHSSYKHKEFVDMWTKHTPGTMLEMPWGVFYGYEGVCKCYLDQHCDYNDLETRRGRLNMHLVTTEVLEVAEDGMTARGVWLSPGIETDKGHPAMTEEEIDPQTLKMLRAKLGADMRWKRQSIWPRTDGGAPAGWMSRRWTSAVWCITPTRLPPIPPTATRWTLSIPTTSPIPPCPTRATTTLFPRPLSSFDLLLL